MRLRKIGLSKWANSDKIGGLFFPIEHKASLAMYCDRVTLAEYREIADVLRNTHTFSSVIKDACRKSCTGAQVSLFQDVKSTFPDSVADVWKGTNRSAVMAYSHDERNTNYDFEFHFVGIQYHGELRQERHFMESPRQRGGVPPFEPGALYLEIAPWVHHDPVAIACRSITEFETPVHQRVWEGILSGAMIEYAHSALYNHLIETGRKDQW